MSKPAKPILLLDTQIISYAAKANKHPELSKEIASQLKKLDSIYELAISGICRYELFQGSTLETAQRLKKFTDFLRTFDVDADVLNIAAVISSCYEMHEEIKGRHGSISIPDRVIGATAMIQNCHILTSDFNDFPRPFFVEHEQIIVKYKTGSRERYIEAFILKPDIQAYSRGFKECYPIKT